MVHPPLGQNFMGINPYTIQWGTGKVNKQNVKCIKNDFLFGFFYGCRAAKTGTAVSSSGEKHILFC